MSNPYNNPYVLSLLFRIKDMGITMEDMEGEVMEGDLMEEVEGATTMILINQVIRDTAADIIKGIGSREMKMQLIVVPVSVRLVVLVAFCLCVCVDVYELIFAVLNSRI